MNIWIAIALISGIISFLYFVTKLKEYFALKEFFVMLYVINYLFAPAIIYLTNSDLVFYNMKIPSEIYFPISILGITGLILGLYTFNSTTLFTTKITTNNIGKNFNQDILVKWIIVGHIFVIVSKYLPSTLAFPIYLLSMIRFVGAFGLFAMDTKKNLIYIILVLTFEFITALKYGMFHDFVMWSIFFFIYYVYLKKIGIIKLSISFFVGLFLLLLIQSTKSTYRSDINRSGNGGVVSFYNAFVSSADEIDFNNILVSKELFNSITRVNQGWIFSGVIDNMNMHQNFQQFDLVLQYLEAAFLPRILAKDKIRAGNKDVFNRFSGWHINSDTSMGLGVFSDGYIAFGTFGVFFFGFLFGLLFSICFKVVKNWTSVSPITFLFILPIMNYAIRPDCELQTILGHLFKSMIIYSIILRIYINTLNTRALKF